MSQLALPGLEFSGDYHDFFHQLAYAEANSKILQLTRFYKSCFPDTMAVEKVKDRKLQRQGIDTRLTLYNMKRIYFDEKIRKRNWSDILLEEYSVWKNYPFVGRERIKKCQPVTPLQDSWKMKPGWISGQKLTDYITYVIKPSLAVYFLPFLLLRKAWLTHYSEWVVRYGRVFASNEGYVTTSVPVPVDVLYRALFEVEKWTDVGVS